MVLPDETPARSQDLDQSLLGPDSFQLFFLRPGFPRLLLSERTHSVLLEVAFQTWSQCSAGPVTTAIVTILHENMMLIRRGCRPRSSSHDELLFKLRDLLLLAIKSLLFNPHPRVCFY